MKRWVSLFWPDTRSNRRRSSGVAPVEPDSLFRLNEHAETGAEKAF